MSIQSIQVARAYADCHDKIDFGPDTRNLNFRPKSWVSPEEALRIIERYIPDGYNEFNAKVVAEIFEILKPARVQIARENSPCLYLKPKIRWWFRTLALLAPLPIDGKSIEADGTLRLWFD